MCEVGKSVEIVNVEPLSLPVPCAGNSQRSNPRSSP